MHLPPVSHSAHVCHLLPSLCCVVSCPARCDTDLFLFFFNDTATTEIYTLSLHDALPIFATPEMAESELDSSDWITRAWSALGDRKSTRLNSSHMSISYAVFCLKKKKKNIND